MSKVVQLRYAGDMFTWINSAIGTALCFLLGTYFLHLSPGEVWTCVWVSQLAGFLALLLTLRAEKIRWVRKNILNRSLKTWALFASLYLGILLAGAPAVRDFFSLCVMFLPLLLGNGLAIKAFGPVQDFLVRREQRCYTENI